MTPNVCKYKYMKKSHSNNEFICSFIFSLHLTFRFFLITILNHHQSKNNIRLTVF